MNQRMYVLASRQRNYSKPYVQAAHALSEFALQRPEEFKEWSNHTLVFLGCDDIEKEYHKLCNKGVECVPFYEPDYEDKMTAVCVYMNEKHMSRYSLM